MFKGAVFKGALKERWNSIFGGGCPICRDNATLTPLNIKGKETRYGFMLAHLLCDNCGLRFSKIEERGISQKNWIFNISEDDPQHVGKTFTVSDWARLRKGETPSSIMVTVPSASIRFPQVCSSCLKTQPDTTFTIGGVSSQLRLIATFSVEGSICSSCHKEIFGKRFSLKRREAPIAITVAPKPVGWPKAEQASGPFTFSFQNSQYAELFRKLNEPRTRLKNN